MKKLCGMVIGITLQLLVLLAVPGQRGVAQSADEYEVTLKGMGYQDRVASGPRSSVYYYFNLPPGWEILDGSYILLDLEYDVLLPEGAVYPVALLDVQLNYQPLQTEELLAPGTQQLRVALPPDRFLPSKDPRSNTIQILFREYSDCESNIFSSVKIKDTSTLHLVYREGPLPVDLALFPMPIYQKMAFEPTQVRFVLPGKFDEADVRAAAVIAARLGQLTSNQLPISATLASEQLAYVGTGEHLIIVGSPDDNPIIGQLTLPVSVARRQFVLRSQMPMTVTPGSILSYTIFVENTAPLAQSLIVEDRFSPVATFLGCGESCAQVASGKIRWGVGSLAAGQSASTTVILRVAPSILLDTPVRHTATMMNQQGDVLNVDTLASQIGGKSESRLSASSQQKSAMFFVQGTQAVPEDAGVIQEIISPQSPRHVVVIVTGLTDEALLKAAHGLNPRNQFPGMAGTVAIVEDAHISALPVSMPLRDIAFASLGYEDTGLNVLDLELTEYLFDLPPGLTLGEDSYLMLHLAHSAILSTVGGGMKVTLNGVPIGSANFDDSNLSGVWLPIPLSRTAVQPGLNRIRIQSTVTHTDRCIVDKNNSYWVEIYANSYLHLNYIPARTTFSLGLLPYPFNRPGDLSRVIFALPETPSLVEVEGVLRIASWLGSASKSRDFMPLVTFGEDFQASRSGRHIVAIGLPTANPAIRGVNARLPQPFVLGSNDVYQSIDGPIYGIPPGTVFGFVQELASPWDSEGKSSMVAVTGTADEGVRWALSAFSQLYSRLTGNLAIVQEGELHSISTQPLVATEVFSITVPLTPSLSEIPIAITVTTPTLQGTLEQLSQTLTSQRVPGQITPTAMPTKEDTPPAQSRSSRPKWLILLFAGSVLAVVVSIVWVIRQARS